MWCSSVHCEQMKAKLELQNHFSKLSDPLLKAKIPFDCESTEAALESQTTELKLTLLYEHIISKY
jgi:hypothetical protein